MIRIVAILCTLFVLNIHSIHAQYSLNSWGGGQPQFTTYADMIGQKTENNQSTINIQRYNGANNVTQWRLTARLTQDYTYGAYSVGAQHTYLQFNNQQNNGSTNSQAINVPTQPIQLSKYNEVTLIQSNVPLTNTVNRVFSYNLIVSGGNHLLISPNGTYHSAYEFKLYRITGGTEQLVATRTESVGNSARFQINYTGNYGDQSVVMQNGAQLFNLQFSTAADYSTGKSATVANAIKVTSSNNYQLSIKASGSHLTSATTTETIPVSVLKAQLSVNQSYPGLQINSPITLSASDQIIAVRSQYVASIQYNLRFYISPNTPGLAVTPGTYSTYVYFVIIPN